MPSRRLLATARRSRDPAAYRVALELYAGDLLPEDRYEEWTQGRREELRQLYIALLIELAGLCEEHNENELSYRGTTEGHSQGAHPRRSSRGPDASSRPLGPTRASPGPVRTAPRSPHQRARYTSPAATTRRLRDEIAIGGLSTTPPAALLGRKNCLPWASTTCPRGGPASWGESTSLWRSRRCSP